MRLLFELVDLVENTALQNVGAHRAIHFGPEYNKRWGREEFAPTFRAFLISSAGKESACNVGDLGSIPGLGRYPGERKGSPLQCSGLENSMDCVVQGVAKSQTTLRLSLSLFFSYSLLELKLVFSCPQTGIYTIVFTGSQTLGLNFFTLNLNYTTGFLPLDAKSQLIGKD